MTVATEVHVKCSYCQGRGTVAVPLSRRELAEVRSREAVRLDRKGYTLMAISKALGLRTKNGAWYWVKRGKALAGYKSI